MGRLPPIERHADEVLNATDGDHEFSNAARDVLDTIRRSLSPQKGFARKNRVVLRKRKRTRQTHQGDVLHSSALSNPQKSGAIAGAPRRQNSFSLGWVLFCLGMMVFVFGAAIVTFSYLNESGWSPFWGVVVLVVGLALATAGCVLPEENPVREM